MAQDSRMVTVHYRRFARTGNLLPGQSLADAVGQALTSDHYAPDWRSRVMPTADNPDVRHFTNNSHVDLGSTFGDLCSFTGDEMQAVISTGQVDTPAVNIADIRAPDGRDYLHGMAYWLLVGDHCYVIQHSSVRTKALESYLAWLLRQSGHIEQAQEITLQAAFEVEGDAADVGDVTAIEIGGIVPEPSEVMDPDSGGVASRSMEIRRTLEERIAPFHAGRNWLDTLVGSVEADRIMAQIPEGAALKFTLQVGYIELRRQMSRAALDHLAVALRNLDDGEVRIRGRQGRISGNEARLHMPVRVRLVRANGNLLDFVDAHEKLESVHAAFVEDGRITPD